MSSTNADSMTNAQGEFAPKVPPSEPLTTKGHQVGQIVSDKDAAPEFHAKTLPAGTAPAGRTFHPNPLSETPGQADNANVEPEPTSAESTLVGADSRDVHTGIGHPGAGQSSREMRHTGQQGASGGYEAVGAPGGSGLREEEGYESHEARRLKEDHTATETQAGHNVSLVGAEEKENVKMT